ncbi:type IV pilus assembly protein PilW [Nitrosococcus halophilus Nc 4]|uniref:Type IV pilus assembly protein PilW n=1 Tax=Nitrosococcus halophilus (strain Nc4) TaxID=472759 RepID=D5BYA1_NITHN|nr:PilW family protein [Nitrosococcus halophilus]ADE14084.1 type IV pilus assembly protein PilW [Nitrosococcus halophilus Nc 4]
MSPPSFPSRPLQQGLSIVEILVALTAGFILIGSITQIFANSKQGYRVQEALSRLQENGRFAIEFISRDVRSAGFFGCAGSTTRIVNTLNNANQYAWDFSTALQGFEAASPGTWAPALDTSITNPLDSRDVITIRHASGDPTQVVLHPGGTPPGSADIQTNPGNGLNQFDVVMVSDCIDSAIFQISSANPDTSGSLAHNTGVGTPGNATQELGKEYTNKATVIRVTTSTYYLRNNAEGDPALYRIAGNAAPQELIEGVEDMQILYGEDTDGNREANAYVTADNVIDWNNVINVRLSLLLQTLEDNLAATPQPYTFNGATTTPNDRRLRRVFTATVNLRNRTL